MVCFQKKGWFYIPMDVRNRELYGKLLLALFSAENGFHVVIGQENSLVRFLSYMPKGVYMHYGIAKYHVKALTAVQAMGHKNVALDEEGLAIYSPDMYLSYRISPDALKLIDKFYAWGNFQTNTILSKFGWTKEKILVTGNPRFDVLRNEFRSIFQDDVKKIINKYGNFILINTNFASSNHFKGPDFGFDILKKRGLINSKDDEIFHRERLEHQKKIRNCFVEMIREVSDAFPDHGIVLRPHPSENQQFWREITSELTNVKVVHEGYIVPWLLAAETMVHNGCTTGIESFLIKTPAIAFCPIISEKYDNYLPNALSYIVSDTHELKKQILNVLKMDEDNALINDPERRAIAQAHIASIDGEFACERIVNSLEPIMEKVHGNDMNLRNQFKLFFIKLYLSTFDALKRTGGNNKYLEHKFEELELSEVLDCIKQFHAVSGRFGSIKASRLGKSLYYIRCVD
jgi:surface carbohydrate biosynthesis protein